VGLAEWAWQPCRAHKSLSLLYLIASQGNPRCTTGVRPGHTAVQPPARFHPCYKRQPTTSQLYSAWKVSTPTLRRVSRFSIIAKLSRPPTRPAHWWRDWKNGSEYDGPNDWVFASPRMHCKQPLWPDMVLRDYIRPAAERAGIEKKIGFHTFRHGLGTLLTNNGENIKTVQELLRHANPNITMKIYVQGVTPTKMAAQDKIVQSFMPALAIAG